jgi:uncharacterized protein (DUF885 family)
MSKRELTAIDILAEKYFDETVASSPIFMTDLGMDERQDEWDDFSPAGHEDDYQRAKKTLVDLATLTPVDDTDRVTAHALNERLSIEVESHETGEDLDNLNGIESSLHSLYMTFDLMPTETAEQRNTIARRLLAVPAAVEGWYASELASVAAGKATTIRQCDLVSGQAETWVAPGGVWDKLAARIAKDAPAGTDLALLEQGTAAAKEATVKTITWLRETLRPLAVTRDGVGPERYALASAYFVGTRVDQEATYEWGKQQVADIEARQVELAAQLRPGLSVIETKKSLDADPKYAIASKEAFQKWMQATANNAIAALNGTHFDIPAELQTIECMIAPSTDGGVWYTSPSEDFARPGRMWWSVTPEVTGFGTWAETTTVYHEGVPGHHLQIGTAVYQKEQLNRWRQLGGWTSGHGEGWALYAETLMQELGFMDDPGLALGLLDSQAMRAVRVVIDFGVHCHFEAPAEVGGGEWTFEKALQFFKNHVTAPEGQTLFEVNRYFGWAGQAPAYKIGQKTWLEIREAVREREGAAFDLKKFHTDALNLGGLSLDTLRYALLG